MSKRTLITLRPCPSSSAKLTDVASRSRARMPSRVTSAMTDACFAREMSVLPRPRDDVFKCFFFATRACLEKLTQEEASAHVFTQSCNCGTRPRKGSVTEPRSTCGRTKKAPPQAAGVAPHGAATAAAAQPTLTPLPVCKSWSAVSLTHGAMSPAGFINTDAHTRCKSVPSCIALATAKS